MASREKKMKMDKAPVEGQWPLIVEPQRTPYVAQMKDRVVYVRQGHAAYVETVKSEKLYDVEEETLPWIALKEIKTEEFGIVQGIDFEIVNGVYLCVLQLAQVDFHGSETGKTITIKYHDMPEVVDFIILKQYFDLSIQRQWKQGDIFKVLFDDMWYFSTITSITPRDAGFPESLFQTIRGAWKNVEEDPLSPWELEPVDQTNGEKAPRAAKATSAQQRAYGAYSPGEFDWPPHGKALEEKRIGDALNDCLEKLKQLGVQLPKAAAVVIPYPLNLSMVKGRLEKSFYRRSEAIAFDIQMVAHNIQSYFYKNKSDGDFVVIKGLLDGLLEVIENPSEQKIKGMNGAGPSKGKGEGGKLKAVKVEKEDSDDEPDPDEQSTSSARVMRVRRH